MCKYIVILWISLLVGSATSSTTTQNALVIFADDLNERIGPYGDRVIPTPNLDRLAARGVTFRRSVCQQPFCAPSRASILSGLYPWRTGTNLGVPDTTHLLPTRENLPQHFRRFGYDVSALGKVRHVRATREECYHELIRPSRFVQNNPQLISSFGFSNGIVMQVYDSDISNFQDSQIADLAIKRLQALEISKKPFCMMVGFESPHDPYVIPKEIWDKVKDIEIIIEDEPDTSASSWGGIVHVRPFYPLEDNELIELRRAYYAEVMVLDQVLGRLLDELDRQNLWQDTIVIFASDHGFSLGEHKWAYSKGNLTKASVNSPMIIAHPEGVRGESSFANVQLVDIFPTLIDSCGTKGIRHPVKMDGRSLMPLVREPSASWPFASFAVSGSSRVRPTVFSHRCIHRDQWKYVETGSNPAGRIKRLFNMDEDSGQFVNLLRFDPTDRHLEIAESLEEELENEVPFRRTFYGAHAGSVSTVTDRDSDGVKDEVELALQLLGFADTKDDSVAFQILMNNMGALINERLHSQAQNSKGLVLSQTIFNRGEQREPFVESLRSNFGRIGLAQLSDEMQVNLVEASADQYLSANYADQDQDGLSDELETQLSSMGFNPNLKQEAMALALLESVELIYWSMIPQVSSAESLNWRSITPIQGDSLQNFIELPLYGLPNGVDELVYFVPVAGSQSFFVPDSMKQ